MTEPAPSKPSIRVVIAEIEQEGRYLLTQRRAEAVLPLLWEFPGGRVREGESDTDALRRALQTRLGVGLEVGDPTLQMIHEYDDYNVEMVSYRGQIAGQPSNVYVNDHRWVSPEEFGNYQFPSADQATVGKLLSSDR